MVPKGMTSLLNSSRKRLFPFLLLFIAVLPVTACEKHEKKAQALAGPVPVTALTVVSKDIPIAVEYVAQTQSSRLVNINARVNGFLDRRVYTEGALVKEGETLFRMDQKPFKVQLDQAKAALAKQESAKETARLNLARVQPLTKLNALSQKDLDDATGQFQSASAAVDQAKAQVETAKLNLSYTVIASPVNGISSAALQTDGTYISRENSLLTTVAVLSPIWVNFSLSENQMQWVRDQVAKGQVRLPENDKFIVEIVLVDGSLYPYTGQITFRDPSYNQATGTFLIRASVENPDGILRPNQYVRARLKGPVRPNAILVPQRAVQQGPKGHFVWVISRESKAEMRPVIVGSWHEKDWIVDEGLRDGEQIAVDGVLMLRPGTPVTVRPQGGQPSPPVAAPAAKKTSDKDAAGHGK